MWLGLFQPLLHDRVLCWQLPAAGDMTLDDGYDRSALARRWRGLVLSNQPHKKLRETY